ncbi:MAG: hypothetical protein Q9224_003741, partial [Gallowayella concinna]
MARTTQGVDKCQVARSNKISGVKKRGKKRGWPKGKPRKAHKELPKASQKPRLKKKSFPFMDLPLELRRHFYELVLPQQDVTMRSNQWAVIDFEGSPNPFMNLLLVNKKVSDEARSVLYGANRFTIVLCLADNYFLHYPTWLDFGPFPESPSLSYIKNWQIALWPRPYGGEDSQFCDAVMSACAAIKKTPDLQSLKLTIPCLCESFERLDRPCRCSTRYSQCWCLDIEGIHDMLIHGLAPLNLLRFKGQVQLVAVSGEYMEGDERSKEPHEQCQKPHCLSFAASFDPFMATLTGNTTPISLTENQVKWLELKSRVLQVRPAIGFDDRDPEDNLSNTWKALDSGSDIHFEMEK